MVDSHNDKFHNVSLPSRSSVQAHSNALPAPVSKQGNSAIAVGSIDIDHSDSDSDSAVHVSSREESSSGPGFFARLFCCFSRSSSSPTPSSSSSRQDPTEEEDHSVPVSRHSIEDVRIERRVPHLAYLESQSGDCTGRHTLVLDLDETLVHSSFRPVPNSDYIIPVEFDGIVHEVYVSKRPGVDIFLREVGQLFEVVIFTASLSKYANPVIDALDIHRVVSHRLFREACVNHAGNYVKDLSTMGRDMQRISIIDNSPASYLFQPDHAIPISSWFDDPDDRELDELLPMLRKMASSSDVTDFLREYLPPAMLGTRSMSIRNRFLPVMMSGSGVNSANGALASSNLRSSAPVMIGNGLIAQASR